MNKKILTHVHIYYPEIWGELKTCLYNIDREYDLYITIVENNTKLINDILSFNANAKIEIVENKGFDVGPFIHILNKVDLNNYKYVVKLHTKRDLCDNYNLDFISLSGSKWRRYLLNFISKKDNFNKSIKMLEENKIGMIADYRSIFNKKETDKHAEIILNEILKKHNLPKIKFAFVAGTMFVAKAKIFLPLRGMFCIKDFETSQPGVSGLAHAIERLIGYLVYYDGKEISYSTPNKLFFYMLPFYQAGNIIKDFLYNKKITNTGKLIIEICKIRIYSRMIR